MIGSWTLLLVAGLFSRQIECRKAQSKLYFGAFFTMDSSKGGWNTAGVLAGVEIALEDLNNSTEILNGYELNIIPKDTWCESGYGTRQFIHLIQDQRKPIMLLGGGCSRSTEPIADTAQYWNLVQIGYGASSTALSNKKTYPLFLRTNQPEHSSNPAKILIMKHFGWSKVATLHNSEFLFSSTMDHLLKLLAHEKITRLASETFEAIPKYQIANIKAYLQGLYGDRYVWIIPGWYVRRWWAVKDPSISCTPEQMRRAAGNYITTSEPVVPNDWNQKVVSGKFARDVRDRYIRRANQSEYGYNAYYTYGYDATWAMALALNNSISILRAQGKSLENFTYQDNETSALFKRLLFNMSFNGMTGKVSFDKNGDRIGTTFVAQLQGDEEVTLAYYDGHQERLIFDESRSFNWMGGSPPKDQTMMENKLASVHFGLFVCVAVMSSIGIMVALVFLIFNIRYRKVRFMKMSSPRLNVLTIAGCIAVYTVVTLYGMDGSLLSRRQMSILCQVEAWLGSVGFTLAYGALFAKTWRVHVIFTRRTERKVIKDGQLVGIVAGLLLIDIIILSCWQALDPLRAVPMYFAEVGDGKFKSTRTYVDICLSNNIDIWSSALYVYKGLLLLFGAFLAWETRNVTFAALNDSRNIAISVYTVTLSAVVGIPVVIFVKHYPNFTFAITAVLVFLCTTLTLMLIFVPKITGLKNVDCDDSSTHDHTAPVKDIAGPTNTNNVQSTACVETDGTVQDSSLNYSG